MSLLEKLFGERRAGRDLDAEVHAYVDLLTDEKVRAGMGPEQARRAARLEAGTEEQIKDEVRDRRRGQLVAATLSDLRHGLRLLRRSPGFATVAILTIGLGIGANSAIFSVVNAVVRKPLAYPQANRLMFITSQFRMMHFDKFWMSPPEYFDYAEHTRAFSRMAAYTTGAVNLSEGDHPERVNAGFVTATMFSVLGVIPERGTTFTREQDLPGPAKVVVLSHELWQRAFAGDDSIVGRQIMVQGRKRTVLGVMPPGFDLHDAKAQLWMPLGLDPAKPVGQRGSHFLYVVGRLAPGATARSANAELQGFLTQWRQWVGSATIHVPNDSLHRVQLTSLQDEVVGNVRNALWVLQGAVILVLLIACANVANLLLARAETRHKEFAVRTALGAGKLRILRQFLAEGLGLSLLGAALGIVFAYWGLHALLAANPDSIPRAAEVRLDLTVLGFTIIVALATGTVFGLAPLLHLRDVAVVASIREGSLRTTAGVGRTRVRHMLVVSEIALAVMLVVGAGLLIRTFQNLTSVDLGFDPAHRITFGVVLPGATYPDSQRVVTFISELTTKLEQIPGVQRAAAMQGLPPSRPVNANDTQFEDYTPAPGGFPANVDYYQPVTAGYFETMGIGLIRGRTFTAGDAFGGPVVMVNEALERRFYPGTTALGKRIRPSLSAKDPWYTVVGVVKDVKQNGVDTPAGTELYLASEQSPRLAGFAYQQMNIVLQVARPLSDLSPAIRQVVTGMDAALPVIQLRTMDDVVGASLTRQRFLSMLLGIFALVALALAAIGTYGILSFMVTERHREIGIRMALGAASGEVMRMVMGQGIAIALVGIVAGLVGAAGFARLTKSLLFGVSPSDPVTFGGVAAVIAVVAVVACLVPSWRAARVDPLVAIRSD